jgi:hypothetical protein
MDLALWNRLADVGEIYAIPEALTIYTIRKASVSSANLALQQTAAVRIQTEIAIGRHFSSFDEFERHMEDHDPEWNESGATSRRRPGVDGSVGVWRVVSC